MPKSPRTESSGSKSSGRPSSDNVIMKENDNIDTNIGEDYEEDLSDDEEEITKSKKSKMECYACDDKFAENLLCCVFYGDYKWGTGQMVCKKCIKKSKDTIIYAFKHDGRFLWYDLDWLLRFKIPHGYRNSDFFTTEEIERYIGRSDISREIPESIEECDAIRKKFDEFYRNNPKKAKKNN